MVNGSVLQIRGVRGEIVLLSKGMKVVTPISRAMGVKLLQEAYLRSAEGNIWIGNALAHFGIS
jgi:hypothetical protein